MSAEQAPYDIFFSYARADNREGAINRLVQTIQAEYSRFFPDKRLRCFFDTQSIENGDDWRNRLYTGLKNSRIMICMLSGNYLASPWCRREWQAWCEIERSRGWLSYMLCPIYYVDVPGSERRIEDFVRQRDDFFRQLQAFDLRRDFGEQESFMENECLSELASRQIVDLKAWYHEGEDALRHDDIRKRIESLAHTIDAKVTLARNAQATEGDFIRANRHFRGRIHELKQIRQCFSEREKGIVSVLHGLAGEGKTALALAYAHAFAYDYPGGRFRIACEGASGLKQCFVRLGEEQGLNFPDTASLEARYEQVWSWLNSRSRGRCLVVLDNVDRGELLSQSSFEGAIRPSDRVHVLATTRCNSKDVGAAGRPLAVTGLSPGDSLQLLDSFRAIDDGDVPHALLLARRFGGHALSLELAGAFLRENPKIDYACFAEVLQESGSLETLEQARQEVSQHVGYEEARLTQVELLLAPSLESLNKEETLALLLAAYMAPESVSGLWIHDVLTQLLPERMKSRGLIFPWEVLQRKLTGLCIWQEESLPEMFRMHGLVREVVLARCSGAWQDYTSASLSALLYDAGLRAAKNYTGGRPTWQLHHFFAVSHTVISWLEDGRLTEGCLELPRILAEQILRGTGRMEECESLIAGSARVAEAMAPGLLRDKALADVSISAGLALLERGNPPGAVAHFALALDGYEKQVDAEETDGIIRRAHCLNYLGAALLAVGDMPGALMRCRAAAKLLDDLLLRIADPESRLRTQRELGYSLDHLAKVLALLPEEANHQESIDLYQRALDIHRELVGLDSGNTLLRRGLGIALDRMGDSLLEAGKPEEAGPAYAEALEIARDLHAQEPQNVVFRRDLSVSYNNKGNALMAEHRWEEALGFYEKSLAIRRKLVEEDPENQLFLYDYSFSHIKCGEALLKLERHEEALGCFHAAFSERGQLARIAPANGRYRFGAALALEKKALACLAGGQRQAAVGNYEAAVTLLRELRDETPEASGHRKSLDEAVIQLEAGRKAAEATAPRETV